MPEAYERRSLPAAGIVIDRYLDTSWGPRWKVWCSDGTTVTITASGVTANGPRVLVEAAASLLMPSPVVLNGRPWKRTVTGLGRIHWEEVPEYDGENTSTIDYYKDDCTLMGPDLIDKVHRYLWMAWEASK